MEPKVLLLDERAEQPTDVYAAANVLGICRGATTAVLSLSP